MGGWAVCPVWGPLRRAARAAGERRVSADTRPRGPHGQLLGRTGESDPALMEHGDPGAQDSDVLGRMAGHEPPIESHGARPPRYGPPADRISSFATRRAVRSGRSGTWSGRCRTAGATLPNLP